MKTLLNIGSETLLLTIQKPEQVGELLALLRGSTPTRSKTIYGPEGELKYDHEFYRSVEVLGNREMTFSIQQIHDDDVVSAMQLEVLQKESASRGAAFLKQKAAENEQKISQTA